MPELPDRHKLAKAVVAVLVASSCTLAVLSSGCAPHAGGADGPEPAGAGQTGDAGASAGAGATDTSSRASRTSLPARVRPSDISVRMSDAVKASAPVEAGGEGRGDGGEPPAADMPVAGDDEYVPVTAEYADYGGADDGGDYYIPEEQPAPEQVQLREFGAYVNTPTPDEEARSEREDFSWVTYDTFAGLDQQQKIALLGRMARVDHNRSGVLASVTMAQCILESGWMASGLAAYENYFGIKASSPDNNWIGSTWKGTYVNMSTQEEYVEGELTTISDGFRVYDNAWQSMLDHSAYLVNAHRAPGVLRYPGINKIKDPRQAVQLIKDGGYATSSTYVDSVMSVIDTYHLTDWDR